MDENNKRMGWNDTLPAGETGKPKKMLLPEGEYNFTVAGLERGDYPGSAKLPACYKATVTLSVDAGNGHQATHTETFYLCDKLAFTITNFFCSLGMMQRGVPGKMQWDNIVGKRGRAYFKQKTVPEEPGKHSAFQVNEIDHFLDYDPANSTEFRLGPGHLIPDFQP